MELININFDFTTDTPHYWDNFWDNPYGIGGGKNDPDSKSKTLQKYHQLVWNRQLPNGEILDLKIRSDNNYLVWNSISFGSDSILASFRYKKYESHLEQVASVVPDYKLFIETFLRKAYTIGGTIIFPKNNSINRARGINPFICDRWDLTLECIRKYYNNEDSPLYNVLNDNREFFDLFVDFRGYVDFFFLQDCVSSDYKSVTFWIKNDSFKKYPLP